MPHEPIDLPTEGTAAASQRLDLSEQFLGAFNLMEKTSEHIFLTGSAGVGKSTLLNYFRENTAKNIVVVAPTGVAALNVGGQTIHSFFKMPIGFVTSDKIDVSRNKKMIQAIDTIVIDEISMVRADLLDGIDYFMRLNGRDKKLPFGGAQVVFIGDLFQLPPVVASDEEKQMFQSVYNTPYFFSASVMQKIEVRLIALQKIYRQDDENFIALLNRIRTNEATVNDHIIINNRYLPDFTANENDFYITLSTTNDLAQKINIERLAAIREQPKTFTGELEGNFDRRILPADEELSLKRGAQVMFIKNDQTRRWVNGTIGKVREILPHLVKVEVEREGERRVYNVERVEWSILKYDFDSRKKQIFSEPVGIFTQFPLKLAWAVTIHKSQGKSFDKVMIDLGRGAFAHGQLYVALSRCRTLEGIVMKSQIQPRDIQVDSRIVEFMRRIQ
jgi:ATP-dependent DNA helicase PIF1